MFFEEVFDFDGVAFGLAHLAAFGVDHKAVGEDGFEG